jgi:hypothetical protein
MAMRSRLAEIDVGFDKIQVALHRHLDALAEKVEARIAATDRRYVLAADIWGTYFITTREAQEREWG